MIVRLNDNGCGETITVNGRIVAMRGNSNGWKKDAAFLEWEKKITERRIVCG